MIGIIFWLLHQVLYWYTIVVIAAAVFSMLAGFGVVDTRNRLVWSIGDFLYRATEPALRPIRNFLPNFGSIDLSPLVLLLLLQALGMLLDRIYLAIFSNSFQPLL
jgi:YggT family protein